MNIKKRIYNELVKYEEKIKELNIKENIDDIRKLREYSYYITVLTEIDNLIDSGILLNKYLTKEKIDEIITDPKGLIIKTQFFIDEDRLFNYLSE